MRKMNKSDIISHRLGAIDIYDELPSTNDKARALAACGADDFTAVVAECQTAGRGTRGHSFYSPTGTGVYFSIVLRPRLHAGDALLITTAAACAAAEAIDAVFGTSSQIKWVNDIYINSKKVCGILTESTFDADGGISYAILGVGVNIAPPCGGFPDCIGDAGAVATADELCLRGRLIGVFADIFADYYDKLPQKVYIDEYRRRSMIVGRNIDVIGNDTVRHAIAVGIRDDFSLDVIYDDGTSGNLTSAYVSVKPRK